MEEKLSRKIQVISEIIRTREKVDASTGKTAVQKLVFLMQNIGLNLEYKFILYTYGPYSPELMDDIDEITNLGFINTEYKPDYGGYVISSGKEYEDNHLNDVEKASFSRVINDFSSLRARELELRSTILFIKDRYRIDNSELLTETKKIKPSFTDEEILIAIKEMKDKKYITI
jgi:uncharacterized protein YwgA